MIIIEHKLSNKRDYIKPLTYRIKSIDLTYITIVVDPRNHAELEDDSYFGQYNYYDILVVENIG